MPPNRPEMPGIGEEHLGQELMSEEIERESRIQTAIENLYGNYPVYSIRKASSEYGIHYNTI